MTEAPQTLVVTGASGWLGRALLDEVADSSAVVRCLVQSDREGAELGLRSRAVEVVVGDVRDPACMDRLFDGMTRATVIHAAAVIHPTAGTRECFDVNVGGTALVLDHARRVGVERLVHVSSSSPFGFNIGPRDTFDEDTPYRPYLAYGRSKMEAEQLVARAADHLETVVVRAPWFYGPHQPERQTRFLRAVRRGVFPVCGAGANRRSLVYVHNLVDGLLRAATRPGVAGRSYWVADPAPYPMHAILDGVRAALEAEGLHVTRRAPRVPTAVCAAAARVDAALQGVGRYAANVHVLGELHRDIACSTARAERELDYRPAVGLVDGMRAAVRWCLERGERL
jgi:nucleoside-diphosphate-sugar epimerase